LRFLGGVAWSGRPIPEPVSRSREPEIGKSGRQIAVGIKANQNNDQLYAEIASESAHFIFSGNKKTKYGQKNAQNSFVPLARVSNLLLIFLENFRNWSEKCIKKSKKLLEKNHTKSMMGPATGEYSNKQATSENRTNDIGGLNSISNYTFFLLGVSLVFYGYFSILFLGLLLFLSTIDYIWAIKSERSRPGLLGMIGLHLGVLFFFKYLGFLFGSVGLGGDWSDSIVLPLGISFYTFQSISYLVDVYRGEMEPENKLSRYLLYITFFPQLVAGPIVKAKDFLPQIRRVLGMDPKMLRIGVGWILLGFFKKAVLSDRLASTVDFLYQYPGAVDSAFAWVGIIGYSFQIFLDFSGYTDIAIGLALLFGFRLRDNFAMPYLSLSISEFWNRWHISLSGWLKDYLYIPLGGNRYSKLLTYRNLILVMVLGGIWHGANWTFLIWGLFHGILLCLDKWTGWGVRVREFSRFGKALAGIFCFLLVTLGWTLFRAPDFQIWCDLVTTLFSGKTEGISLGYTRTQEFLWITGLVVLGHIAGVKNYHPKNWDPNQPPGIRFLIFTGVAVLVLVLGSVPARPFIYFIF
jgi:D-alanyl-lipoteichoic acid acyltransferase DltB (MBOAT superfamily)